MMRLAVLAALFSSSAALACTCVASTYASDFATSGVAFEGIVDDGLIDLSRQKPLAVMVRVTRVFKGHVAERVLVTSSTTSCGRRGLPRGVPVVFLISPASDETLSYETHACDGTTTLASLEPSDLAVLGQGVPPTPRSRTPAVLALSVLFVLAALILGRMKKRAA